MKLAKLGQLVMASPPVILIALFIGLPVINAIGLSLGFTGGLNETLAATSRSTISTTSWAPTWQAWQAVFETRRFWEDLVVTILVTALVTVIVVVVAWVLALYLRLRPSRISAILPTLAVAPMFIPGVIGAWALLNFWADDGLIGSLFTLMGLQPPGLGFTTPLVVIAQVWGSLPFAVLMITSGVAGVPDALIEAGRDAGASTGRIIWSVIVPLAAMPTIIAGTFTAIGVIGSFTVPFLAGPNAPTMLGVSMTRYFNAYGEPQASVIMAIVVFILASGIGALYVWANWRGAGKDAAMIKKGRRRRPTADPVAANPTVVAGGQ